MHDPDSDPPSAERSEEEGGWADQWVWPFLREPVLWPVAVAIIGHVVLVQAWLLVEVWRAAAPQHTAAFGVLVVMSVGLVHGELRSRRRPGAVAFTVVASWAVAALVAWGAGSYGIL